MNSGDPAAAAEEWVSVEEWDAGASSRTALLTVSSSSLALRRFGSRWRHIGRRMLSAFVPEGFPASVTPDYVSFQIWDSLQGLSTYIRSMLSTHALLTAIGVGEKSATVIGATFQWFLRDFTGMLGGILFSFYQGSNLDCNAKTWRLVADLMNDLGMLMDLLSPLYPSSFVAILCLGSLSRSFTGVASGATRAALTQHFALANNAADISAKENSQETVATMVGMIFGMLLAHIIGGHHLGVWISFLLLTVFHIYANYKAVQSLSLKTLNYERVYILLKHFMQSNRVLTPNQVSRQEHILPLWSTWRRLTNTRLPYELVHLGVKASTLTHADLSEIIAASRRSHGDDKYMLLNKKGEIHVLIHKQATPLDVLRSFVHALVSEKLMRHSKSGSNEESDTWMVRHYPKFLSELEAEGWVTARLLSPSILWRAHWVCGPSDKKLQ